MTGVKLLDYQAAAVAEAAAMPGPSQRICLYYKTGAGKTYTSLACLAEWGHQEAVVITPPSTYVQWENAAQRFGITVSCMSHAKYRMKDTKLSRSVPVIADEFHLFGGHTGKGWVKFDTMARLLQAPIILASATPNYNDAERVYCIKHVLDPHGTKGGYLEFIYANCETEANPFAQEPKVTGFRNYASAAEYLSDLPGVMYLPDDLVWSIVDVPIRFMAPVEVYTFGYNERRDRIIASQMEERHTLVDLSLIDDHGLLWQHVYDLIMGLVEKADTPVMVFAAHATVAKALAARLHRDGVKHALVHGGTPAKKKQAYVDAFKDKVLDVLVGTATLATGTDGLDKVCNTMVILDDTDDDSLRRQLVGRIMPRGLDTDASMKSMYRLVLS